MNWAGSEQGMSGAAAVICPEQDCSFFSQLLWPHSSLIVLLLAGSCSNINCSSLLSRPSVFVIPCSLPRCCFLCPLGSLCLSLCVFFSWVFFFYLFFTMSAVVSSFWTQCDHEALWGHLVSFSRLFSAGAAMKLEADGLLLEETLLPTVPFIIWSSYQGADLLRALFSPGWSSKHCRVPV